MSGYFGIGVEGLSKPMNAGSLFRTANAFGASFVFTIGATYHLAHGQRADTSRAVRSLPHYDWADLSALVLPRGCPLIGVELLEEACELPRFRHPVRAAYVLGPERGSVSPDLMARCDEVIQIPTQFCVNVAIAGALVMYDRLISTARFGARAQNLGAPRALPAPETWRAPPERSASRSFEKG